jgi:hypothetical protein
MATEIEVGTVKLLCFNLSNHEVVAGTDHSRGRYPLLADNDS